MHFPEVTHPPDDGAPTPGAPGYAHSMNLHVGQLNVGLAQAMAYSRGGIIVEKLAELAQMLSSMANVCHVICLNEFHPRHVPNLRRVMYDERLWVSEGFDGSAIVWCLRA